MHTLASRLGPGRVHPDLRRARAPSAVPGVDDGDDRERGVVGLVHTLAVELAPVRVNGIHPAVVGDSPYWADKPAEVLENLRARTPLGRLVTMDEVVDASVFLLENTAVTGVNLDVDGGWLLR